MIDLERIRAWLKEQGNACEYDHCCLHEHADALLAEVERLRAVRPEELVLQWMDATDLTTVTFVCGAAVERGRARGLTDREMGLLP